jgi:hypothetical protein
MTTDYNPLEIDLNLTGIPDKDALEGDALVPAGWYHTVIEHVEYINDRTACLKFRLRILEGTEKSQIGKRFTERFFLTDGSIKRLAALGNRLGLVGDKQLGTQVRVDWSRAVGKQLVVETHIDEWDKNGKTMKGTKLTFMGFYGPHDSRVAHIPKSTAAMEDPKSVTKTAVDDGFEEV